MYIVTLDSDWAPQFVVEYVLNILEEVNVKATIFLTSDYKIPEKRLTESALHPNYLSGSSQGNAPEEIIKGLKKLIPQAVGARSHSLYWHNGLFSLYKAYGLQYDSSIFLPFQSGLKPVEINQLIRMPIWWGDGFHLKNGLPLSSFELPNSDKQGLKILNFHPIHIYLNTNSIDKYLKMKGSVTDISSAEPEDLDPFRSSGHGMETFFRAALLHISNEQNGSYFMKEIMNEAR